MIRQQILRNIENIQKIESIKEKEKFLFFVIKNLNKGDFKLIMCENHEKVLFLNKKNKFRKFEENIIFDDLELEEKNIEKSYFLFGLLDKKDSLKNFIYKGNGGKSKIYHNSKRDPSTIIFKNIDKNSNWYLWNENFGMKNIIILNKDLPLTENTFFGDFPNNLYISVTDELNYSDSEYLMILLFNSDCFYSNVYLGNGEEKIINTGFPPGLVIIKNISSQSNWCLLSNNFDTGEYFKLNTDNEIQKNKDLNIYFEENGIIIRNSFNMTNKNNNKYLLLCFRK
jgi:hypothetical protein